jgi:hypothetical protein
VPRELRDIHRDAEEATGSARSISEKRERESEVRDPAILSPEWQAEIERSFLEEDWDDVIG